MEGDVTNTFTLALAAVAFTAGAIGCGGGQSELVSVRGTVLYRGAPVAGAHVAFRGDGSARPAVGLTDEAGRFTLVTGNEPGVSVGDHMVTVTKFTVVGEVSSEHVGMEQVGQQPQSLETRPALPLRYAAPATSDLRCRVTRDGNRAVVVELTD